MRSLSRTIVIAVTAFAACRKEGQDAQSGSGAAPPPADFRNPQSSGWTAQAPDSFRARFETSKGTFVIAVHRAWAPLGASRFYNLVRSGYYDGARFFRVLPGFMAQFGIHGDPKVNALWRDRVFPDDPVRRTNIRGMVSFATAGPGTRTTQVFINYGNNDRLDAMGFAPFGQVVQGMEVVDSLYSGYGEGAPGGRGPIQGQMQSQGNRYLDAGFPRLDRVIKATVESP